MPVDPTNLPAEDDFHEYKSGITPIASLKDKLGKAASAFWNSGGGIFIVGAESGGRLDTGVSAKIGQQPIRDWIDQIIMEVQPAAEYMVTIFEAGTISSHPLKLGRVIVIVEFAESHLAPHMAPDGRYYIRAGAHSVSARSFIVEALWARRQQQHPRLVHMLREKQPRADILQLVVVNISPEPALDVELRLDPLPEIWKDSHNPFPLIYPVVDRSTPIKIDLSTWHKGADRIGKASVLYLQYKDSLGRVYFYEKPVFVQSYTPWVIGTDDKLVKATDKLASTVEKGLKDIAGRLHRRER